MRKYANIEYGKRNFALLIIIIMLISKTSVTAQKFNLNQTLSDGAQKMTIAFDALAFFTGSLGADSFFPPGKVADFWGFQYLRDNDPTEMGHNTDFLTKASLNLLHVLNAGQFTDLINLAKKQVNSINQYGYNRFVLMKAFRRFMEGDTPAGKPELDKNRVKEFSASLYILDGQISYERAVVMGHIINTFNNDQRAYLDAMVGKGMLTWPTIAEPTELRSLTHDEKVAVMTYAGDIFSWYAGSIDADVYFCPERQGTYFGSFYLKDAPAVGNPNYTIGSNLTADYGDSLLTGLTTEQAKLITDLVIIQKQFLLGIVEKRTAVSTQLRKYISGQSADSNNVIELMRQYGELDGEIVYNYANNFGQVFRSLNQSQRNLFVHYRKNVIGDLNPTGAYLYASEISIPAIINTDDFFTSSITSIDNKDVLTSDFCLNQNYPNPFNPSTVISYYLPQASNVILKVYDITGREVALLADGFENAGSHKVQFNTSSFSLSSGIYFYSLKAGDKSDIKKMVLLK